MQRVPTYRPTLAEALGGKPTPAERKVLAAAKAGEMAELSPLGIRPVKATAATRIRAGLIRFLMLGGDDAHPVHPKGVLVQGAWIIGKLDMAACETQLDLKLRACHFDTPPNFNDAHLGGLYLPGCLLPGLAGQRLRLEDNLHLRTLPRRNKGPLPFESSGPVDITGARIAGQLSCVGGRFDRARKIALACDAVTVRGSVFLSHGFHATGKVSFVRSQISGTLHITNARINGVMDFTSGHAEEGLVLYRLKRVGAFGFGSTTISDPPHKILRLNLTEAHVGVLRDNAAAWGQIRNVRVSGFRFGSIQSRMTVSERLGLMASSWQPDLAVSATGQRHFNSKAPDFDPRAYGELARAYLRQGERKAAARVLEAREDRTRDAELRRALAAEEPGTGFSPVKPRLRWLLMWAFKGLFGYGHSPARVLLTLGPLWLALALFFGAVYDRGQFAPNSDVILTSTEWLAAVDRGCPIAWDDTFPAEKAAGCQMPQHLWTSGNPDAEPKTPPAQAAKDYETFGRWLYAADLFLPLDTIGQTEAWAPSKDRGWWGVWGYYLRFPVQLAGWIIVAMAAAVVTGLIGRKED